MRTWRSLHRQTRVVRSTRRSAIKLLPPPWEETPPQGSLSPTHSSYLLVILVKAMPMARTRLCQDTRQYGVGPVLAQRGRIA